MFIKMSSSRYCRHTLAQQTDIQLPVEENISVQKFIKVLGKLLVKSFQTD